MLCSGNSETGYSFYCALNDILYPTESAVKTLDVTFKVIYALDLRYQIQCKHVWSCIQNVLFDIKNQNEKCSISTDIVIAKIKHQVNKL